MATAQDLREAILEGAAQRVRPVMMTVAAIMGGLLPIMWTTGTGADVMKRIAAPMIGGMVSSTILTLLVIPVLYALWRGWSVSSGATPVPTGTDRSLHEQEGISVSERQSL
jgi:Cu(I)/Ag(I) efflux system membrane protein CusA/SilA